ncbi:MAG: sugar transferase [Akkermansiaceae bacterium]|nr:sugar transferase [Akkermansiaceae bacterium]
MTHSRKDSLISEGLQIADALLVFVAFWLGGLIRFSIGRGTQDEVLRGESLSWILFIAVPLTPLALRQFRFYQHLRHKSFSKAISQIFQVLLIVTLVLSSFLVFTKQPDTRRLVFGFGLLILGVLLFTRDRLTQVWLNSRLRNESDHERVVIVGTQKETADLLAHLGLGITGSWNVVAQLDLFSFQVSNFFELLKNESVSRVIFAAGSSEFDKVALAVEACELQGVEAWISASFISSRIARPTFDVIGNKPMLVLRSTPELSWALLFKAVVDRVGAPLLILATSPLWIFAAIGIRLSDPGAPILFSQMRAGRYGKPFRIWKFRTMVANAPELLDQVKEDHGNQMDGPVFKLKNDPRIFPFGALLRKLSIDELPQLLNVSYGEMSLVGPRPLPTYEVDAFSEITYRRRLSVKPGITCEWQAGGRNKITSFDAWVKMDLEYIDNWSLLLDLKILLKTIPAVLFSKGAS